MVIATVTSFGYRLFFLLHILAIIVAYAPAFVTPLVAARSRRNGTSLRDGGVAGMFADNSRQVHGPALVLAAVFGLALVGLSDKLWTFSQTWVSIAFVLWFLMVGVLFGLLIPAERKVGQGDEAAEQRVAMFGGMMHILLLLMLIDMIWKPGA